MKGVLICGGTGSRLRPLTHITHKSLLPVYNQPLIYYPLQTLLQAGITDIVVITGPESAGDFIQYLGSGTKFNCTFTYKIQDQAGGIAQALGMAEQFAAGEPVCAILGDNIFLDSIQEDVQNFTSGGHIFVTHEVDPRRFGVVEICDGTVVSIEEKPLHPKSNFIQTGCYIYDNTCFNIIRTLKPSARNELEITDVTNAYIQAGTLRATVLQKPWIDAGTFDSLLEASNLISSLQVSS